MPPEWNELDEKYSKEHWLSYSRKKQQEISRYYKIKRKNSEVKVTLKKPPEWSKQSKENNIKAWRALGNSAQIQQVCEYMK